MENEFNYLSGDEIAKNRMQLIFLKNKTNTRNFVKE